MSPIRVILHPTDFSPCSDCAFRLAYALARDYGARLVVMHAYTLPAAVVYEEFRLTVSPETQRAFLDRKLRQIQMSGGAVPIEHRLVQGFTVEAILQMAADLPADLIVLGTHGRTGLRRLLLGSVAEQVLRRAGCPVLTARPPAEQQEAWHQIKNEIQQRFMKVALRPSEEQKFPIGSASAKRLGYDAKEIDSLPKAVTESFAGVGNPLALAELQVGQTVFDLGGGAGLDSILAARKVGPSGRVIGVDFAPDMVDKATRNAVIVGTPNVEFRLAEVDALPLDDATVDVVISNGVFNLCLDKPKVLAEVFRVLRPGGRIQMADILLEDGVTPEEVARKGAWSD